MSEETGLSRRGFMGVFGGITAAGLIVKATPQEIQAFTAPLVPDAPLALGAPSGTSSALNIGELVFNSRGEIIGVVEGIEYSVEAVDDTRLGDTYQRFRPGRMHMRLQVAGVCRVGVTAPSFELRGYKP